MEALKKSRNGFKAYDIRGIVPTEVDEEVSYRVGRAYADQYKARKVAIGRDIRESSPRLSEAVARGLTDGGVDVYDIGVCGTEMVYFATFHHGLDGGIMVTASHNPVNYNGLKLVREEGIPISADTGLKEIEERVFAGHFAAPATKGVYRTLDVQKEYIETLLQYVDLSHLKPMHIVVNAGNGGAGLAFNDLKTHLPFTWHELYMDADATFPHGVPNPMIEENRLVTSRAVVAEKAQLGVAWDGDFDRCFFVDEKGNFVEGYYVLGLLAEHFLTLDPHATIVHDPRLYWNTQAICERYGATAVESKGGHAFMKETMRRVDGLYGAEMSAHHFFRDFSYCDSGMIPWLLVAQIICETGRPLSQLIADMEAQFPCSGEINRVVKSTEETLVVVEEAYRDQAREIKHLDGLSMDFGTWRFNLRQSNTEPLVRFNLETRGDRELMKTKRDEVLALIETTVE